MRSSSITSSLALLLIFMSMVVESISLRKAYVVIFALCGGFCGGFHPKSKSPQIFVAILFKVGSKVKEHYI